MAEKTNQFGQHSQLYTGLVANHNVYLHIWLSPNYSMMIAPQKISTPVVEGLWQEGSGRQGRGELGREKMDR